MQRVAEPLRPSTSRGPGRENQRAGVGDHDPLGAERVQAVGVVARLQVARARRRSRTGRRSRPRAAPRRPPPTSAARTARPRRPSRSTPPAYSISCGTQWPPTKTGSSHSSIATRLRGASLTATRTRSMRAGRVLHEVDAGVLGVGGLRERAHVAEHLAERVRVQRDDLGHRVHLGRDRAHVVDGDRADAAQRLGDDQVGLEVAQADAVELVDRAALLGQLAHRAVDLVGSRDPARSHRA